MAGEGPASREAEVGLLRPSRICLVLPHHPSETAAPSGWVLAGVSSVLSGRECPLGLSEARSGLSSWFSPKGNQLDALRASALLGLLQPSSCVAGDQGSPRNKAISQKSKVPTGLLFCCVLPSLRTSGCP